jgi:outer membrane receptor protein involved in Fe transport
MHRRRLVYWSVLSSLTISQLGLAQADDSWGTEPRDPAEEAPAEEAPAEEAPAEEAPAEEAPATASDGEKPPPEEPPPSTDAGNPAAGEDGEVEDDVAAEEIPVDDTDKFPADEVPVDDEDVPMEEYSEDDIPIDEGDIPIDDGDLAPEGGEIDPAGFDRPPPRGKGAVWGIVRDTEYLEPAVEALVTVVGVGKFYTDIDGRFRFVAKPGKYDVTASYEGHHDAALGTLVIELNKTLRLDVGLKPDADSMDVIVVETQADTSSLEGQTLARKRSASVGDAIGSKEMSKAGASDAAQAAQRLVGANIVGGRFVYVRGLGQRYTNALLNGAPLPSPEPDQATVPLDLFPSAVLDSLTIAKSFTPDSPGNFAGGSVRIRTKTLPEKLVFKLALGSSYNSQATFNDRLTYKGGQLDWLGMGDGSRALPSSLPEYKLLRGTKRPDGSRISNDEVVYWGDKLNSSMSTRTAFTPPNYSGSVSLGNSWKVGNEGRVGLIGALTYGRSFEIRNDEILRTYGYDEEDDSLFKLNDLVADSGIEKVRWGAFGNLTYQFNDDHRIDLVGLRSQSSDKMAREIEGYHESRSAVIHDTQLRFTSRSLVYGQLRGQHKLTPSTELDWNATLAEAVRDEPDRRGTVYTKLDGDVSGYSYVDGSDSGEHFFSKQAENTRGGGVDLTQRIVEGEKPIIAKLGGMVTLREREFDARRFAFRDKTSAEQDALTICPVDTWHNRCSDGLFTTDNINSGALRLEESTRANDAFTAGLDVYAGYAMGDIWATDWLRLIGGVRIEQTKQFLSSFDPHAADQGEISSQMNSVDTLPSLAVVYAPSDDFNTRVSAARTLARPELRELAPFAFSDYFGGRPVQGNPDLEMTYISNFDVRFEYFPTMREALALSLFFKDFADPVEKIIKPAGGEGIVTYENADSAQLFGAELEVRKNLAFLSEALRHWTAVANVTVAHSVVHLGDNETGFVTNQTRALQNQAPYIVNTALDYDNPEIGLRGRLLYNVHGATIAEVGTAGLPDIYQQPRPRLDAVITKELGKNWSLKLSAKNILNSPVLKTQGAVESDENIVRRYTTGTNWGVGLSYSY